MDLKPLLPVSESFPDLQKRAWVTLEGLRISFRNGSPGGGQSHDGSTLVLLELRDRDQVLSQQTSRDHRWLLTVLGAHKKKQAQKDLTFSK